MNGTDRQLAYIISLFEDEALQMRRQQQMRVAEENRYREQGRKRIDEFEASLGDLAVFEPKHMPNFFLIYDRSMQPRINGLWLIEERTMGLGRWEPSDVALVTDMRVQEELICKYRNWLVINEVGTREFLHQISADENNETTSAIESANSNIAPLLVQRLSDILGSSETTCSSLDWGDRMFAFCRNDAIDDVQYETRRYDVFGASYLGNDRWRVVVGYRFENSKSYTIGSSIMSIRNEANIDSSVAWISRNLRIQPIPTIDEARRALNALEVGDKTQASTIEFANRLAAVGLVLTKAYRKSTHYLNGTVDCLELSRGHYAENPHLDITYKDGYGNISLLTDSSRSHINTDWEMSYPEAPIEIADCARKFLVNVPDEECS